MSATSDNKNKDIFIIPQKKRLQIYVLLLSFVPALLQGCGYMGFRPMYGSLPGQESTDKKLAQIEITTIPGRVGQQLRNEIIYQSTGGGRPDKPVYRLEVAIRESVTATLVQQTGDARGQIYNLDASFKLIRISDKQVVLEGTSFSKAGFERYSSIFSNVRARMDAENRAAKTMGEELKTRLAAYLASAV